jgi:hypothetical protein
VPARSICSSEPAVASGRCRCTPQRSFLDNVDRYFTIRKLLTGNPASVFRTAGAPVVTPVVGAFRSAATVLPLRQIVVRNPFGS